MSLELARSLHEDLEVLERAMYEELGDPPSARRKRPDEIARDQVVSGLLEAHAVRSGQLSSMHADADSTLREEIQVVTSIATDADGAADLEPFYSRLGKIQEYHARVSSEPSEQSAAEQLLETVVNMAKDEGFTGEEADGRYVDMCALHDRYLNLKAVERIDYRTYLKQCINPPEHVSMATATSSGYPKYLKALQEYLTAFLRRTQPLVPIAQLLESCESDLRERWSAGDVNRWQGRQQQQQQQQNGENGAGGGDGGAAAAPIELSRYQSAAELEALGLETLKRELASRGLKAGGSLQQRAVRLHAYGNLPAEAIPRKELGKPPQAAAAAASSSFPSSAPESASAAAPSAASASSASMSNGGGASAPPSSASWALALSEETVSRLGGLLEDTLEATRTMVEKKQVRTYEEIERDLASRMEDEAALANGGGGGGIGGEGGGDDDDDDDDDEKPIYNPLNLPLGFDGKPIPYWLYKLHGLNLEFKCEICGNYSYWGPRPFERHFQEWRHSYGMKCLGIPNTKPFHGVTRIADAYAVHAKIKAEEATAAFAADVDEEFEDRQGNVMNRKIYTDLARQGLLK